MASFRRKKQNTDPSYSPSVTSLFASAAVMAVITVAAKALGLLRDIMIAESYGTGIEATAYETASRLPILIFDLLLGGVVTSAFIPTFSTVLMTRGKAAAKRFSSTYLTAVIIITSLIAAAGMIFAEPFINILAPALDSETAALAVKLTRIMFPMVIFTGVAFTFVGILQSLGEYTVPALISLISNLVMTAYLFTLSDTFGIIGLAFAMLIGWASQALVQLPRVASLGFLAPPSFRFRSPELLRSLSSALPILISTWTQPICMAINTSFASGIEDGRAITALGYSNRLYTVIIGIFSFVATNLLFPYFSRMSASGDDCEAKRLTRSSLDLLIFVTLPIAVGIALLSTPFTAIIFERGEFTASDTAMTALALRCFALGMPFLAANEVLGKAFFAKGKPRLPMIASVVALAVNIILVMFLAEPFGIAGIALSSAASALVSCALDLAFALSRRMLTLRKISLFGTVKSVFASSVMAAAVCLANHFLSPTVGTAGAFFASSAIGAAVYFALSLLLRHHALSAMIGALKNR